MPNKVLDFRSDTVTKPTPAMRAAMAAAEVGDDVFDEDPSIHALQERIADMLGQGGGRLRPLGHDVEPDRRAHPLQAGRRVHLRGGLPHLQLRARCLRPAQRRGRAHRRRRDGVLAASSN